MLLECHERIRAFIGLAGRLANTDEASEDDRCEAATRVRRYFAEALPLHVADEEETILPRLSGRDMKLDAALQQMHREHAEHQQELHRLLETCTALQASPAKFGELREKLRSSTSSLECQFNAHLALEEEIIIPAIRQLLTSEDRIVMLDELRARR
jgi:iron-sulfur cluster repair protein YtfE (RIC family)